MFTTILFAQITSVLAAGNFSFATPVAPAAEAFTAKQTSPEFALAAATGAPDGAHALQSQLRQNMVYLREQPEDTGCFSGGIEGCVPQCAKGLINKLGSCFGGQRDHVLYVQQNPCGEVVELQAAPVEVQQPCEARFIQQPNPCEARLIQQPNPCEARLEEVPYERYELVQRPVAPHKCCCPFHNNNRIPTRAFIPQRYIQTIPPMVPEAPRPDNMLLYMTPEVVVDAETRTLTSTATSVSYEIEPTVYTKFGTDYQTVATHTLYPVTTQTLVENRAYVRYPGATVEAEIRPSN